MQAEPEAFGSVSEAERIQKIRRFKLPSFNSKTSFLLSSLSERAPVKRFQKAGVLRRGDLITNDVLDAYGNDSVLLTKLSDGSYILKF